MEHGSRTKLVAALVLASVFGSGFLLGYAVDGRADAAQVAAQRSTDAAPSRERRRRPYIWESMDPTEEQRARLDSIMQVRREQMNRLHADFGVARQEYQSRYDAVVRDTREAMAAVFPPEKAAEYRRLVAESDRRREEERASEEGRASRDAPRD
jgi:hypothetical protein